MNLDYLGIDPLLNTGTIPASSPRMTKFSNLAGEHGYVFQSSQDKTQRDIYINQKFTAREERLAKYYQNIIDFDDTKLKATFIDLISQYFHHYPYVQPGGNGIDFYDTAALCVEEDFVIVHKPSVGRDTVVAIHLCQPYDWSAEWAIGKSFAEIHERVTKEDGSLVMPNPDKIVDSIIKGTQPLQRIGAVSFRPGLTLSHHPDDCREDVWHWGEDQEFYLRFERQVIYPIPDLNSFLFTIRPIFVDLLNPKTIEGYFFAVENAQPNNYATTWLKEHKENALNFLKKKMK